MSEFQYYEWQTIDRLLTSEEQAAVSDLSSHIEVSPSRAVVTYNWSDFRYDSKEVLLQYFDAHFYFANWGSLRLMFRFPKGLLDTDEVDRYCDGEYVSFETIGEHQVLEINFYPEDGGDWIEEPGGTLSDFVQLRDDLLMGDFRLLYLAWLKAMTFYGTDFENEESEEYETMQPPIPPGLKKLTIPLHAFVRAFDLDPYLVQAAAEDSPDMHRPFSIEYRELVSRLPRSEADDFLARLAEGDAGARLSLRKRLMEFVPKETAAAAKPRPLQALVRQAEQLESAEKERLAEEARRRHIAEMKDLAQREPQIWKQVDDLLENGRKIASVYDEATRLIEKLKQLADYQGSHHLFYAQVRGLADKYSSRSSLMNRWRQRGWL